MTVTSRYESPASPPAAAANPYPGLRVTAWRQTAAGPVALRTETLPEGWIVDEFGAFHTAYAGVNYKITGGEVYRQNGTTTVYPQTGQGTYLSGTGGAESPVWEKVPEAEVPSDNGFRRLWKASKVSQAEALRNAPDQAAGWSGTTSPGVATGWENRPASMGGPLNPEGWLGSETLAEQGYTPAQIAAYSTRAAKPRARDVYSEWEKGMPYQGTYYQRAAMQNAVRKGYGRPQYTPQDVAGLASWSPQQYMALQADLIRAGVPGASSIVLGAPLDPATQQAAEYAMTQANIWGVPLGDAVKRLASFAAAAQNGQLIPGSDQAQKFDPVKTRTSVNLTGKAKARAQLRQMMSQLLGRMPTNGEVEAYLAKLNSQEKADPTVTTYRYQRDGDVTATVEQSDVDPTLIAERSIKQSNPREYQAMQETNYYNAILEMIGA